MEIQSENKLKPTAKRKGSKKHCSQNDSSQMHNNFCHAHSSVVRPMNSAVPYSHVVIHIQKFFDNIWAQNRKLM